MGDKGRKDKGKREQQKKAQLSAKDQLRNSYLYWDSEKKDSICWRVVVLRCDDVRPDSNLIMPGPQAIRPDTVR